MEFHSGTQLFISKLVAMCPANGIFNIWKPVYSFNIYLIIISISEIYQLVTQMSFEVLSFVWTSMSMWWDFHGWCSYCRLVVWVSFWWRALPWLCITANSDSTIDLTTIAFRCYRNRQRTTNSCSRTTRKLSCSGLQLKVGKLRISIWNFLQYIYFYRINPSTVLRPRRRRRRTT